MPRPLRVIQVVNVRWFNATAWYGLTLGRCLRDAGHESLVLGIADSDPMRKAREWGLEQRVFPFNSVNPLVLAGLAARLDGLLREFRPDVVNCHRGEAFFLWAMLKRRYGFRLVRTRGDQRLPKNNAPNRFLHCQAADEVIATNSTMARHFREVLRVPQERLHTILGGVDTTQFFPDSAARVETRTRHGFADDEFVVGLVGRLDVVKGIPETIRALAQAREMDPKRKLRLLLIAFPSQYDEDDLSRWCAEVGLKFCGREGFARGEHADVALTGKLDFPERCINALDLGLVASLGSEAIARAALEIMACNIPLVSSSVGVMPDLLPAEYLFRPGDQAAMAALVHKSADRDWREALRAHCLARIVGPEGLSLPVFLRQSLDVYRMDDCLSGDGTVP